jgi:hypothetical protein
MPERRIRPRFDGMIATATARPDGAIAWLVPVLDARTLLRRQVLLAVKAEAEPRCATTRAS